MSLSLRSQFRGTKHAHATPPGFELLLLSFAAAVVAVRAGLVSFIYEGYCWLSLLLSVLLWLFVVVAATGVEFLLTNVGIGIAVAVFLY